MAEWGGQARPPPDFGRSENGAGIAGVAHYYSPPQILRPTAIPVSIYYDNKSITQVKPRQLIPSANMSPKSDG